MCNVKLKLPAKGVKIIAVVTALLCCFTILGTRVFAESENQSVQLYPNGSKAELVMDFPQADDTSSMQISFVVSQTSGDVDFEFIPDISLSAKITESRYNKAAGIFTLYIAGAKSLFSNGQLTVGEINIVGGNSAKIEVKEDSIKFVSANRLFTPSGVTYPDPVTVSAGESSSPFPSHTPTSATTSNSEEPTEDSSSDALLDEPSDKSMLKEAVNRAGEYKRADYTEDSYGELISALNKAKTVLSNSYASQEEVDEALLVLENAIGMLTPSSNIPSGTEGYGESALLSNSGNGGNSVNSNGFGSPSGSLGGYGSDILVDENGSIILNANGENTASDGGQAPNKSGAASSDAESSGSTNPAIGIIIVLAAVAVTAAFIVFKSKKK